ncbi:MAG TPA: hypothetical protein VF715_10980 [Thermoleophilaceae bacterium]
MVDRYGGAAVRACPGVQGMGVGAAERTGRPAPGERAHVVVVFLREAGARPPGVRSIEGVAVRYEVSGAVEAR